MQTGQAAPWFTAPTPSVPNFNFSSLGGRYVLLAFLPTEPIARQLALAAMQAHQSLYDQTNLVAFGVLRDPVAMSQAQDRPGLMWFLDQSGAVSRAYGAVSQAGVETPYWCLLDPSLRVMVAGGMDQTEQVFAAIRALPAPGDHAGVPLHAPVLIVPRIFEPEMCARLIEFYERRGGERSGTMRQVGGKTVAVLDDFKSRRDATIEDEAFRDELRARIQTRLLRPINRAFQFNPTRIERYIVACYDADDGGGYFKPHRDNTTSGTAHRKFACSINLNAEEFEGGDLRFPEFGPKTYRPPTGGAVVFSCSLLHEATPVTRGRRYAFLPFFFDEAGEALRQKNLHTLQVGDEPSARAAGA